MENLNPQIEKLEDNIKNYVETELKQFFKTHNNNLKIKKLMEHEFVQDLIIENERLRKECRKLKDKLNIITKNINDEYPIDEQQNVFWEVIEKEEEDKYKKNKDKNTKTVNINVPTTNKENKKMEETKTSETYHEPNNYYLNYESGPDDSSDEELNFELTQEEEEYKTQIQNILSNISCCDNPQYINIGLSGMDMHLLESQCDKYEIEDKYYHIVLDLAKKNYADFADTDIELISYTQVLGLSAGIIKWALLNNEDYATIDSESSDEEAIDVEEYLLEFEGKKTKTWKDDDGYIYQYLDDEEIGEILGQVKDGIFIAS